MGIGHSSTGMVLVMVGHSVVAAFNWGATCGIGGFPGRGGRSISFDDGVCWRTAAQQQHHRPHLTIVSSQFPSTVLAAAISNYDREDNIDSDDDDDDVVLDENWSKRAVARAAASPAAETSQLNVASASAVVETGSSPTPEGRYPLIETWLQSYIPALSASDSQTYASILANDGFTTREKLNSINSKASGKVEDLYFMKKDHRRRLMVELRVRRSRRRSSSNSNSSSNRPLGTDTTTGRRTTARPTRIANKELSQEMSPLDESIAIWLAEQSRLVEERAREDSFATTITNTDSIADQGDAQFAETTRNSAMPRTLNDVASKQYGWEGDTDPSSLEPSEGEGSTQDEMQRLQQSRKEFPRRESPNEIILDDLTARYSSLEIKPLDDGSSEKENRRLRELKETFLRRVDKKEGEDSSSEFCTSTPDDFVTRYDSLDTTVALDKIGSAKKEARRLEELKRAYISTRKKKFITEMAVEEEEALRLDLLKRPTIQETTIEQKERIRMIEIQRLARLAAEQKVDRGSQRRPIQQPRDIRKVTKELTNMVRTNAESDKASSLRKYKTNGERRLEALRKNLVKDNHNNADQSVPPTANIRTGSLATPSSNRSRRYRYSGGATRTAIEGALPVEAKSSLEPARRSLNPKEKKVNVHEQAMDCGIDDEECWDITRSPNFYVRRSQSLATTLPPIEIQMNDAFSGPRHDAAKGATKTESLIKEDANQVNSGMLPQESTASNVHGEAKEDEFAQEEVVDVSSSHANSECMQDEQTAVVDDQSRSTLSRTTNKKVGTLNRHDRRVLYQCIQTDGQENRVFAESQIRTPSSLSDNDVLLDVSSRFPETRPFMTVQTRREERFRSKMEDSTDFESFIEQVDTEKQAVRNIALKFSADRDSFLAFPPRRRDHSHPNLSRFERSSPTVSDAGKVDLGSRKTNASSTSINFGDAINHSGEEQVMYWLLTHLPDLREEEAITYFNSLLNDGFDCNESLREILAEDLYFMKIEHREALIHILQKTNEVA